MNKDKGNIKQSGDYIAVKVNPKGNNFRKSNMAILWDSDGWNGIDLFVQAGFEIFDFEILGLISDMGKLDQLTFGGMFEIFKVEEFSQWLIIKKTN